MEVYYNELLINKPSCAESPGGSRSTLFPGEENFMSQDKLVLIRQALAAAESSIKTAKQLLSEVESGGLDNSTKDFPGGGGGGWCEGGDTPLPTRQWEHTYSLYT